MINFEKIIQNRKIDKDFLYGIKYSPSLYIYKVFLNIFNKIYKDFSKYFRIKNIYWEFSKFKIVILNKKTYEIIEFYLDNKNNCKGYIFCTNNICTGIHNKVNDLDFVKFLLNFSKKGNNIGVDTFLVFLLNDFKLKKQYFSLLKSKYRVKYSIIQNWGNSIQKYRFIIPEGRLRDISEDIEFDINTYHIHHSERECLATRPEIYNHKEFDFFNLINRDKFYNSYSYLDKNKKVDILKNKGNISGGFTDLNEDDIVMGKGNDKLINLLKNVSKNIDKNKLDMLSFNCCCVPRIIGDDVVSILEKVKSQINIPFIFQGQLNKSPYEQKAFFLINYLNNIFINKKDIQIIKNSISLFGYTEDYYFIKLYNILLENNIKINNICVPNINIKLLGDLFKSELFIFSKNIFRNEIFEIFKSLGKQEISLFHPYGIKLTDDWLNSIVSNFNLKIKLTKKQEEIKKEYFKKVRYVKEKGHKLAFILVSYKDLENIFNPIYNNDIDIIGFLEEMGFRLEFFVLNNGDGGKIKDMLYKKIKDKKNLNINYFDQNTDLLELLKLSNLDLIYSDIYFDKRVIKLGLNQFNISNFKIGYEGALSTIDELINLCELTYFKKFAKYF